MNLLTLEDEKFKNVTIQGMNFKIRCISPLDRVSITQRRMRYQNGNSIDLLTADEFNYFESIAIVDTCVEEFPKELNSNESCIKWDDINLIHEVASEIRKHTTAIEAMLKKNRPVESGARE